MSRPVAVITGAARGIGLATAHRLAPTHRLALLDRDRDGVAAAAAQLPDAVWAQCDITDAASVRAAVDEVVAACGGIDVCISNAGIAIGGSLRHLDPDHVATQIDVNVTGNWRFIHACLPYVVERRGYVLGVASLAAIVGAPGLGAYAASKAALERLLDVLRMEVRHLGVDVGVAYFSWVDTDLVRAAERADPAFPTLRKRLRGPVGATMTPDAAAEAIARAVRARASVVSAPRFVGPLRRLHRIVPAALTPMLRRAAPVVDRSAQRAQ